ncbi:RagB/SusD family nutrient uptake outer membrane protein [Niabella soli]|uniref:Membrane protein n=1 Tax=Niabella soli DSM 19437 TaxID=929713 RepID=W0F100_9BACT|nr:RagB/SusD family nutrient uptake outer membrane protein [Niabella soli]AHF15134.1 membrane protein [Niabella soli DSM 19437]
MNTIKYIAVIFLFSGLVLTSSCKKTFLKETLETDRGMDFYKTDAGIQSLSTGTYYQVFDAPFSGEQPFCTTSYGIDEFGIGGDASNSAWNNYDGSLKSIVTVVNSNTTSANAQWDNLYIGIGDANLIIENATASTATSDAIKKVALGEGYFFRAYCYLRLVSQYGGVPLKLNSSNTVELEFTRATPEEVCKQIIADFTQAYSLLPTTGAPAKITKYAAGHYLAKAYLFRASEINDSWNTSTKAADLAAIIPLCDEVIAARPLAANFASLWNYTGWDGANEQLSELILSAQFTADVSTNGSNAQHLYFDARYDDLPYMQRDLTGDRPYSRLRPNYYMYRIYDMVNDSRFWKTFRTKHRLNKFSGTKYVNGDLGIIYIIDQPGDTRFSGYKLNDVVVYSKTGKTIPSAYIAYPSGTTTDGALNGDVRFPSLSKYLDGSRAAGLNDTRGLRDIILARSAETYLIAAEAKIRLAKLGTGAYTDALPYINAVRMRAQYTAGEDRAAYYDGGGAYKVSTPYAADPTAIENIRSFMPENSYYESNNMAVTTTASGSLAITNINALPAGDEYVISKLGLTGDYNRMLALVLDERSRELAGEFKRWEDLSRTKTLVPRVRAFNFQATSFIQDYHLLRAIPQTYLDGIQQNGKSLTNDQKQAQQNPGY